jgi:hypothetical protein
MLSIKALTVVLTRSATEDRAMMGRQRRDQGKLFYEVSA